MAYATETPPGSSAMPDAPMLLVGNAADYDGGAHSGRWATSRSMSASDATLTGFAASRVRDGLWSVFTKPNADAAVWYLNLYTDPSQPIDAVVIAGHNADESPAGITLELYTADDDAFTSNVVLMGSEVCGLDTKRRVWLLDDRYTSVARVSLKITAGSAWRPRLGELILAARVQPEYTPAEPYDDGASQSVLARSVSPGGITVDVQVLKGQRIATMDLQLVGETERDTIRDAFRDSAHGGRPVVLLPHPVADPGEALIMSLPEALSTPIVRSPYTYQATIELVERGPFYGVE